MPELPEVETVRAGLERSVVGRSIRRVEVYHPRAVRRHDPAAGEFCALLTGRRIDGARRRGKYLWLPLDSGDALQAHLGMSGQLLVVPAQTPTGPHLRVRIRFADAGPQLRFVDQRTFGGLAVVPDGAQLPPTIAHIARDVFDPLFDESAVAAALRRRHTGVKRALLDQRVVSGIGNIYADEALWRARMHYARPTETLTRPEVFRLLRAVRDVMTAALDAGGTSFDALYVDVTGASGYFERALEVYGRGGEPCRRCGTAIRREAFMSRSSFTCPRCQRAPLRARW